MECISNQSLLLLGDEERNSLFGNIHEIYRFNRYTDAIQFLFVSVTKKKTCNGCLLIYRYVTLDHKTSLKCQFFEIEIYTSSES